MKRSLVIHAAIVAATGIRHAHVREKKKRNDNNTKTKRKIRTIW
jgi:hypothetical protein